MTRTDTNVPDEAARVAPALRWIVAEAQRCGVPYLVREPTPYRSASWDLTYLKLDYRGQPIELGDTSSRPRIFNQLAGRWEDQTVDFAASTPVTLFGVDFLAMPLTELIAYKSGLDRPVDRVDVADLRALSVR